MCGIWARTAYKKQVPLEELLHPIRALHHRGPDGYGWYADAQIALVHTRLSIIDLAGGSQPLTSSDQRWIGIVNGELYDYDLIRERLLAKGIRFNTQSDSEVLLNLYVNGGPAALENISGEFAFIFYDLQKKQIHFGRDPVGVKPLFFESREDSFTLASEMKALQNESPVFDPVYVKTFLAHTMAAPRTCLQNVEHVWPGRIYTLDLQTRKLQSEIYTRLPLFQKRNLSGIEAEAALDESLRASVRRRLKADVEVGCYLSGGIDSALIAALTADCGAQPHAFTVGFADKNFDESTQAAQIAQDLGLKHSIVHMTSKNFMDSLIRSIVAFENPVTNPHGAAKNLLSHMASQHVKVILSGEGADEWFGGYAYLRIKKIKDFIRHHPKLSHGALENFMTSQMGMNQRALDGESSAFDKLSAEFFAGKSPVLLGRIAKSRWYNFLTGEKLSDLVEGICTSLSQRLREENPGFEFSDWDLNSWVSIRTDLLHYILANVGDRQEMSHSIEGRTPFLDPQVLKVAGQIKEKSLMRGLKEKYVLRRVGAKYLKPEHSQRGKKPFFAPMKYLYLRENRAQFEHYVQASRASTPWLNWKHISHLLNSSGRGGSSALENHIISLKMVLFSLGVLSERLREYAPMANFRGFKLPQNVSDLYPHQMKVQSHVF